MSNRLADQSSPYLLQHAGNPVNWLPWAAEALDSALREEKPIFLSIGYSACHWCHVMAHECFEDAGIARLLNENFISIKVDREERPDLDQVYMEAVQWLTGGGGWPLSVFLTPERVPFFGGTYWPPRRRDNMPGFDEVLLGVAAAWTRRRGEVLQQGQRIMQAIQADPWQGAEAELSPRPLEAAVIALTETFDPAAGGFGAAPKFPQPMALCLLLRRWRQSGDEALLKMVETTLQHMARGGIYDQLGGGFHRYSVDAQWLAPHFEKMLYDNALLAACYTEAAAATGNPLYRRIARETLDYVLRDMTLTDGGFAAAEDADSEGAEGKFYLWTPDEVAAVLGPQRAETFCQVYDVTAAGNFEGRNILHPVHPPAPESLYRPEKPPVCNGGAASNRENAVEESPAAQLAEDRRELLAARACRVRPARDDKVLLSWNGLMVDALARAAAALGEPRYGQAAARAARFLTASLRDDQGRLVHSWRSGRPGHPAFLDDYASLANALATLHQQQPGEGWLDEATALAERMLADFADPRQGGFFYAADAQEPLIVRKKDLVDNAVPSGNGLAVTALLRLAELCHRDDYRQAAENTLRACMGILEQAPTATGQLLLGLEMALRRRP